MDSGKRVVRAEVWRKHLSAWKRSGLIQAAYCRRHGLTKQHFSWWKRRLEASGGAPPQARPRRRLKRSASAGVPAASNVAAFVPVRLSETQAGEWAFEIEGAGGVRLRFRKRPSVSRLRELVGLLSGAARWS